MAFVRLTGSHGTGNQTDPEGGLSFLETYSAARVDPRRTTRATVSVAGPDGKIATVASADMHKLNFGAVFFLSSGVGTQETGRSLLAAPTETNADAGR
jgi:hypothetical protein